MSRNLIILIIIFAVLIGLAMFVLIPGRGDDDATTESVDPEVALQQTAAAEAAALQQPATEGRVQEQRVIAGQVVSLNYVAANLFQTQTERGGTVPVVQPTTEVTQPEPTTAPDQSVVPTLTPIPSAPQLGGSVLASGDAIIFRQYTVGASDTMYSLSIRTDFDTSIGLMALYGIDTSDFVAGNVINLPIVNPNYCSGARAVHLILEGETVFRIADKYSTTIEAIAAANGLGADYRIRTNDVLCIP